MKPCRKCGSERRTASGRCAACREVYDAARYVAKAEEIKARVATYRAANPEKTRAKSLECQRANPNVHREALLLGI